MNSGIRKFVELVGQVSRFGPVVEFGSKQVPWQELAELQNLRPLFSGRKYIGCDMADGQGVDVRADAVRPPFARASVGLLLVCEILEHCYDPWQAVCGFRYMLREDGLMVLTVPFCHPLHHLPDYWRFTPQGLELMLGQAGFKFAIYFQGNVALPTTIYSVSALDKVLLSATVEHLERHMTEIPGKFVGELIYKWQGTTEYCKLRRDTEVERKLQNEYAF